jgi:hypothetical protein
MLQVRLGGAEVTGMSETVLESPAPIEAKYIVDVYLRILQDYESLLNNLEWAAGETIGTRFEKFAIDLFQRELESKNALLEKIKDAKSL